MKYFGLLACAFLISTSIGCNDKEDYNKKFDRKAALPSFYEKLSPSQKSYWNGLNDKAKERLTSDPSAIEQHERFIASWRRYSKNMN